MLRDKLMQDLESMTRLVREGIAYARSAEPLLEPTHRLDLNAFLDTLVCDYTDTGQAVTFLPAPTILPLETRPQALRRIMTTLLDNALKYGSEAQVHLLLHDAQWLEIQVRDNGPGIDEAEQDAVLQPFYRIENSRNRHTGGTGLGLAIVSTAISQHNGKVTANDSPLGGLRLEIWLPLHPR